MKKAKILKILSFLWKARFQELLIAVLFIFGCTGDLNLGRSPLRGFERQSEARSEPVRAQVVRGDAEPDSGPKAPLGPSLDPRTERILRLYGKTIRRESREYGFDWRFILAMMKQESQFVPDATSHRGAHGLMQLMPVTRYEVADALGYRTAELTPRHNIVGGIYYFRKLFGLFDGAEADDRLRLTLAAYNAGPSRVYDAQDAAAYLGEDPYRWTSIRGALPLLSKRYYTLHENIWADGKPRSGYFGGSQETINYVENVMDYYDEFRNVSE